MSAAGSVRDSDPVPAPQPSTNVEQQPRAPVSYRYAPARQFIRWGQFKSTDKDKPDVLEVKPQGKDIWSTEYSKCTNVSYNVDSAWSDTILPLKALNSVSTGLFSQWTEAMDGGKLKVGEAVKILTWLDKSINGHPIRRFMLVT